VFAEPRNMKKGLVKKGTDVEDKSETKSREETQNEAGGGKEKSQKCWGKWDYRLI